MIAKGADEEEDVEEEEESESDDEDDVQIHIGPIETQPPPFYPGRMPIAPSRCGLYMSLCIYMVLMIQVVLMLLYTS